MYAILDENNVCVMLSSTGKGYDNAIEVYYNVLNKKYVDGKWEECATQEPTQLDRIETFLSNTLEEIRQEARDEFTLSLIENGII